MKGRISCKYYSVCGSAENCKGCTGYEKAERRKYFDCSPKKLRRTLTGEFSKKEIYRRIEGFTDRPINKQTKAQVKSIIKNYIDSIVSDATGNIKFRIADGRKQEERIDIIPGNLYTALLWYGYSIKELYPFRKISDDVKKIEIDGTKFHFENDILTIE